MLKGHNLTCKGVGVLAKNCAEAWMVTAAAHISGGYFVPMAMRASVEDLSFIAEDAEIELLVATSDMQEQATQIADRVSAIRETWIIGSSEAGANLLDLVEAAPPASLFTPADLNSEDK